MGLFPARIEQRERYETIADDAWYQLFPKLDTAAGVNVNESNMLESSVVFACVNVISQDIGQLPFHLYKRVDDKNKERALQHPLYNLLRYSPNPEMTSFSFRQTLQSHILTRGNAYASIERDVSKRVKALWVLRPDKMSVVRDGNDIIYVYTLPSGQRTKLSQSEVFHIPGLSFNGLVGYSPITLMRESLALSLAEREYSARFFGNGAMPAQIMVHPGRLGDQAKENIREGWDKMHKGLSKSHRMAILEEGIDIKTVGLSQADSQFIEGRKFEAIELARYFRMPIHKIQSMDASKYNNIETQSLEYVIDTLMPWATQWEQTVYLSLLGRNEKSLYFAEFMFQELLRGDSESRAKFYKSMFETGALSPDDIRAMENLNPIPDGDGEQYFVPLNFIPIDKTGEETNIVKDNVSIVDDSDKDDDVDNGGTNNNTDENSSNLFIETQETRTQRTIKLRNRYRTAYFKLFKDVGDSLVIKETTFVRRAIKKYGNTEEFDKRVNEFYDKDMKKSIQRRFGSVITSYYDILKPEIYQELGTEEGSIDGIEKFTQDYVDSYYKRHISSSLGQIFSLLKPDKKSLRAGLYYEEHQSDDDENEDEEDEITAVTARMDEWEEKRGNKIAIAEIVRAEGALVAMMTLSIGRTLIWQIQGKTTCEACMSLQGTMVEKDQWFVQEGDDIDNGDNGTIHIHYSRRHPPLHYGCDCIVVPG